MPVIWNESLLGFVRPRYAAGDVDALSAFLTERGTFDFRPAANDLFPATAAGAAYTGYSNAWVRDNVQVAHALAAAGRADQAARTAAALAAFFRRHAGRFEAIARGEADPGDPRSRPPVRFRPETLDPDGDWANAQNDALGYFLWLYARLARLGAVAADAIAWDVLALFPPYLRAISYWRDADSGHWEEAPRISASSIGTVVAGLRALLALVRDGRGAAVPPAHGAALAPDLVEELVARGTGALDAILPAECVEDDPLRRRDCDAALLFLVEPLGVVDGTMADRIAGDVGARLAGDVGVRRYLGDSFWCADYRRKLAPGERTRDWSRDQQARDALVGPGEEAEWCLFDPVLSLIAGEKFRRLRAPELLDLQVHHLNRSLGHLTAPAAAHPGLRCPELYHREGGRYETSDATPLLWTQALLLLALRSMRESAALR